MAVEEKNARRTRVMEGVRARKRRHKQRGRAYRISFAAAGVGLIVLGGILALPFVPGPGLVLVAAGLAMLALESDRAERLLDRVLQRLEQVANVGSTRRQKLAATFAVVVGAAALVGALVVWGVPLVRL